ncbi:hypothetical protein WA026_005261 [Henosepilachna vigintioctopunctata]|uniref:Uncharacterized protein n=1 Tax=Henosepilachna vigintioctopunctata TaxID=420089 RepID=A0AAW1UWW8_9CUCU
MMTAVSPNSYGLTTDQVAAKMAAQNNTEEEFDHYSTRQCFASQQNSSDSEDNYSNSLKQESPKRNKRKNFKPRCTSNNLYNEYPDNEEALNLTEYADNNNVSSSRRRKTQSTRKVVPDSRFFPMDLSQKNDSSDSESFNETNSVKNEFDEDNLSSENDSKIPTSFSIHNLSKPHVQKFESSSNFDGEGAQNFAHPQISEMREFAMNTMRELLGIYGLTPDVTESISKQLPIAAFNSGRGTTVDLSPSPIHRNSCKMTALSYSSKFWHLEAGDIFLEGSGTTVDLSPSPIHRNSCKMTALSYSSKFWHLEEGGHFLGR